jgi:peroxiredoxin-like protein
MVQEHDYPVSIRWTGDAQLRTESPDHLPELFVGSPPEFGGEPNVWSPEHLFVASVASCFVTTLLAIAGISKLEIRALEVPAVGTLERGEDRFYSIPRIELQPQVTLAREKDRDRLERLLVKADNNCLVSRSVRSQVTLKPTITVEPSGNAEAA